MFRVICLSTIAVFMLSSCASSKFKERQIQREKAANSAGVYCEFLSGDIFPDLDVELNLKMAQRCDASRNFSITNYKNSSDQNGVMYCCAMAGSQRVASTPPLAAQAPVPQARRAAAPRAQVAAPVAAEAVAVEKNLPTPEVSAAKPSSSSVDDVLNEAE